MTPRAEEPLDRGGRHSRGAAVDVGPVTIEELRESVARVPPHVLSSAARLIERVGFQAASMREIAEAAGVTKPGLYYHVPSKELLLFAIHDRFAGWLLEHAEEIRAEPGTWERRLRLLIAFNLEAIARFKPEVTVFLREYAHLPDDLRVVIDPERDRYRQIFAEVLQGGMDAGEFSSGDAELDALAILGACNWAFAWFDPNGALDVDRVSDVFADRFINGIRAAEL